MQRPEKRKKNRLMIWDIESYIHQALTASLELSEVAPNIFMEVTNLNKGLIFLEDNLNRLLDVTNSTEYIAVVGSVNNFRKDVADYYKANRPKKKDIYYKLLELIEDKFSLVMLDNLEADDTARIIYEDKTKDNIDCVIVSVDKDFYTVPCKLYRDLPSTEGVVEISKEDAELNLIYQLIIGDSSDNYKGIKGYGEKSAQAFMADAPTMEKLKELYKEKKQDDFYEQLNLASIVGIDRYNFNTGEVVLYGG